MQGNSLCSSNVCDLTAKPCRPRFPASNFRNACHFHHGPSVVWDVTSARSFEVTGAHKDEFVKNSICIKIERCNQYLLVCLSHQDAFLDMQHHLRWPWPDNTMAQSRKSVSSAYRMHFLKLYSSYTQWSDWLPLRYMALILFCFNLCLRFFIIFAAFVLHLRATVLCTCLFLLSVFVWAKH